jgi:tRNA(fMet)-specific endonuclease VapC
MTHLLDTCVCSLILRGDPRCCLRVNRIRPERLGISAVTWAEGMYGCARSPRGPVLREMWALLAADWRVLPFDRSCADRYANLRAELERHGGAIGDRDMMIAATALVHDLVLVTANDTEFGRVPRLRLENWCRD